MPRRSPTGPTAWCSTSRVSTRGSTRRRRTTCRRCARRSVRITPLGSPASRTSTITRRCPIRSSSVPGAPSTTSRSSTGRTSGPPSIRDTSTPGSGTGSTGGRSRRSVRSTTSRRPGQIRRFRALAMSHGFDGVSWWSWQSAGKRQWKAVGSPVSPAAAGPYPSYPFLHVGLEGGLRRLGAAAAGRRWVLGPDQRLLPGPDAGGRVLVPGEPRPASDRQPRRPDLEPSGAEQAARRDLDQRRRGRRWLEARVILHSPKSASLPPVRDEIPPARERH